MPHSSGGGSHGGGFHSGGSRGGSSSSGHQTKYYKNAYHYAYYRDGKVHHFYTSDDITPEYLQKKRKQLETDKKRIVPFTLAVCAFMSLSSGAITITKKPTKSYTNTTIQIEDRMDLMTDQEEQELYSTLEKFQEKSNVTPYILTISNSEWKIEYSNLENYAFDYYNNTFYDEMHWLIVYSTDESNSSDWYWEGMQGDDTDPILTAQNTELFGKTLQKKLVNKNTRIAEALDSSFNTLMNKMFGVQINHGLLFTYLYMVGIIVIAIIAKIRGQQRTLEQEETAFKLPDPEKHFLEDKCKYCGGMFIHGIHTTCPHCGGALPPATGLVYVPDKDAMKKLDVSYFTKKCEYCGSVVSVNEEKCPVCGAPIRK